MYQPVNPTFFSEACTPNILHYGQWFLIESKYKVLYSMKSNFEFKDIKIIDIVSAPFHSTLSIQLQR